MPYGPARLPQGNALQIEVEAALAEVRAEKGKASLVPGPLLVQGRDPLRGGGTGLAARGPVRRARGRRLRALHRSSRRARTTGSTRCSSTASRRVAPQLEHEPGADVRPQTQFDGYALETYVGADYQVGWPRLDEGTPHADATCASARARPRAATTSASTTSCSRRRARRRGPRPPPCASRGARRGASAELGRALSDPDPVTRGLAAMELRARGRGRRCPALDALTAALRDPDANVRLMSAQRHRGDRPGGGARGARSHRGLLGAGRAGPRPAGLRHAPSARSASRPPPALPVLREIAKQPRVRWAAEAAIRRIGDDAP